MRAMLLRKPGLLLIWLCTQCFMAPVGAGDVASLLFVGFAGDGSAYYIQYGRQDGSGFPYAILAKSSSQGGEEIERLLIEDPAVDVVSARDKLHRNLPVDTTYQAGKLVFARMHTDISSADAEFFFQLSEHYSRQDSPVRLALESKEIKAGEECYGFFKKESTLSFSLSSDDNDVSVGVDEIKPPGCVLGYRAGRVFVAEAGGKRRLAVFFMMNKLGFEGDDVRWAAFTFQLDD